MPDGRNLKQQLVPLNPSKRKNPLQDDLKAVTPTKMDRRGYVVVDRYDPGTPDFPSLPRKWDFHPVMDGKFDD